MTQDRVLFGAAYYPEYTPSPRVNTDLDLMAKANVSVIRVGESVWATWEPEDGHFDLEWLAPTLDGAADREISVVLGTPTYAVPMWLARKYPEIAAEGPEGHRIPWGGRQEVDFTHAAFRLHAERVVRAIMERYARHPAVVGFQVDNEPGLHLLHNHHVFESFVDWLRSRYGDVARLNRAWGLTYWSHRLSRWVDLWKPHGNRQPQYDLAWRRFQAELTSEFIAWQADIVRQLARPDQWVTTCMALTRPGMDEWAVNQVLDISAGNPYYAMQDALAVPAPTSPTAQLWSTSGTWALFASADRLYASRQSPFLVTETNAAAIGGSAMNYPAWDGQWRQVAWAMVARGAKMIEYWHWHTLHAGTETYWGGVLPHDQEPGRVYEQLSELGTELAVAGTSVVDLRPEAHVGMVYSVPSKWGLSFQPHETRAAAGKVTIDEDAYGRLVDVFMRGTFEAGLRTRVLHDRQLTDLDPSEIASELPVLIAAGIYVADDDLLRWLADYAEAGGHLVLGIRTGYGDHEARARLEVKPAFLVKAAGVAYQEFSNLPEPIALTPADVSSGRGDFPALTLPSGAAATTWVDALVPNGAVALVRYDHPQFGRWPAMTTATFGRGRVTTIGTLPDPPTTAALLDWAFAAAKPESGRLRPEERRWGGPESVTISSAVGPEGEQVHFVHNWSWRGAQVEVPVAVTDLLNGARLKPDTTLQLGSWDVRVLTEQSQG